jgi:AcrR family transcriptional regulator
MEADRKQRRHDRQRRRLLDTASELFAREGFPSVTIRRIAEAADCSQGTFYSYFADKTDLLLQLCRESFEKLNARLDEVEAAHEEGRGRLLAASRAFVSFGLEFPHHFKVFFLAATDFGDESALEFVGRQGITTFLRLRSIYESGMPAPISEQGSIVWWNSLSGITAFENLHRGTPLARPDDAVDLALATMLYGHLSIPPTRREQSEDGAGSAG